MYKLILRLLREADIGRNGDVEQIFCDIEQPSGSNGGHLSLSGGREEFHLPAPTDPYVNLSVHTAL
ncbi:hypothetical protein ACTMTF_47290, partial [Nonomuraea sp. ZG12]|uniref:hypothetical protein n=1 Tax=Nonomuraea sp. ZG12 TaxID=3452207 RepID=UPI003F8AD4C4